MSEKNIKKYSINDLPKDRTDWKHVKAMTDDEVYDASLSDPEAQPLTDKQVSQFKKVFPPKHINVKMLRKKLHVSQEQFASSFGISKRTLQQWEQGKCEPRGPAKVLLAVIEDNPMAVHHALAKAHE